jgi:hypothetical protein
LKPGQRKLANGKKASGTERYPRLVAGRKL